MINKVLLSGVVKQLVGISDGVVLELGTTKDAMEPIWAPGRVGERLQKVVQEGWYITVEGWLDYHRQGPDECRVVLREFYLMGPVDLRQAAEFAKARREEG